MSTEARALLPTDLLLLMAPGVAGHVNESWPRERLGREETPPTLTVLRDQLLSFAGRRSAWVSVRRQKLQALVGARRRGSAQAWEINYLIDSSGGSRVVSALLEHAVAACGENGAEKIFVRLQAKSPLLPALREAGFLSYQREYLYARNGAVEAPLVEMRVATPADNYPIFRLYNATTPEAVRRYEAATYSEWQASQERRWLRNGVQMVGESDGRIATAVQASRLPQGIMIDLSLAGSGDDAASLVASASLAVEATPAEPLLVCLPASQEGVARRLEDAGFELQDEFVSLVRRTTRMLAMPRALPALTNKAIGSLSLN